MHAGAHAQCTCVYMHVLLWSSCPKASRELRRRVSPRPIPCTLYPACGTLQHGASIKLCLEMHVCICTYMHTLMHACTSAWRHTLQARAAA